MSKETCMPLSLAVLIFLLLNPFDWWMNDIVYMGIVAAMLILFVLFALFFWKEKPRDEREAAHASFAGRVAFLLGGGVIIFGVITQSFSHAIDPWLLAALLIMVAGKAAALTWSRSRN